MPRINIGTVDPPIVEIVELVEELRQRGCEVSLVSLNPNVAQVADKNAFESYLNADILYYRSGLGDYFRFLLGECTRDVKVVNRSYLTNPYQSSKLFQACTVAQQGVHIPKTVLVGRKQFSALQAEFGDSFILKAANGIQGKQVHLIHSAEQYVQDINGLSGDVLAQEMIPNTGDYRVFVIGGVVHEIFKRVPPKGAFKANVFQGGKGELVVSSRLREQLSDMALQAARALDLDIVGIDIIEHDKTGELYFIEANVNPGWKGLDTVTGQNTSAVVADWLIQQIL